MTEETNRSGQTEPDNEVHQPQSSKQAGQAPAGRNLIYCSFCGKSNHEVKKLITGAAANICDECVLLCVGIMYDEDIKIPHILQNHVLAEKRDSALIILMHRVRMTLRNETERLKPFLELRRLAQEFLAADRARKDFLDREKKR